MRRLGFIAIVVLALLAGAASAQAATFNVTSVDDTGAGTLRQAITDANADSTADEIHFDVSALGGFISPESPLPAITQPVTIDGTTDPDYFDSPVVFLDGSLAGALANGLVISGGPTTVKGLDIEFFELAGIRIASSGNTLTANSIGAFGGGNLGPGVAIASGAANNTVGGTTAGAGNAIQGNEAGVVLEAGSGNGNKVAGNAIGGNDGGSDGLGIDLNDDGVTANDAPDAVTGRNTSLNFPVLSNVTTNDTSTTITGTLDARAGTQYRVEFFGAAACDPSGNGEGDLFLGSTDVTTDGGGHAAIGAVLGDPLTERFVTATATDPAGNTSEFSACQAGPPSGVVVSNGTVQLGINKTGSLNYSCVAGEPGCPEPTPEGTEPVGLRYVPLNIDSTAPGCPCEGWGVADEASGLTGFANESTGDGNITPVSINRSGDGKTATVVVDVEDPAITGRSLRVTHLYRPSALNSALYEDVVTVENTGTQALADLLFRRVMDWDIEPTAFNEWVTNHGTSPQLRFDSDQGFASSDPLTGPAIPRVREQVRRRLHRPLRVRGPRRGRRVPGRHDARRSRRPVRLRLRRATGGRDEGHHHLLRRRAERDRRDRRAQRGRRAGLLARPARLPERQRHRRLLEHGDGRRADAGDARDVHVRLRHDERRPLDHAERQPRPGRAGPGGHLHADGAQQRPGRRRGGAGGGHAAVRHRRDDRRRSRRRRAAARRRRAGRSSARSARCRAARPRRSRSTRRESSGRDDDQLGDGLEPERGRQPGQQRQHREHDRSSRRRRCR